MVLPPNVQYGLVFPDFQQRLVINSRCFSIMFRDRTNLFLLYRRTAPRNLLLNVLRFDSLDTEERFILSRKPAKRLALAKAYHDATPGGDDDEVELQTIVPTFFDIAKDLDIHVSSIKLRVNDLNSAYKRLIIIAKPEKRQLEDKIQDLSYAILKEFEQCYVLVKKFEYLSANHRELGLNYSENDLKVLDNFKRTYAARVQEQSLKFRNLQNNYIKFLRDDEDEFDALLSPSSPNGADGIDNESRLLEVNEPSDSMLSQQQQRQHQQQQSYQQGDSLLMLQREREISNLAMGILEILTIFKEMESLVVEQGSLLDRIDYNLQNTVQDLKLSDKELIKAKQYQKRSTKCKLIFLLSLVVLALFILVLVKPNNSSTVITKPTPSNPPNPASPTQPIQDPGQSNER